MRHELYIVYLMPSVSDFKCKQNLSTFFFKLIFGAKISYKFGLLGLVLKNVIDCHVNFIGSKRKHQSLLSQPINNKYLLNLY